MPGVQREHMLPEIGHRWMLSHPAACQQLTYVACCCSNCKCMLFNMRHRIGSKVLSLPIWLFGLRTVHDWDCWNTGCQSPRTASPRNRWWSHLRKATYVTKTPMLIVHCMLWSCTHPSIITRQGTHRWYIIKGNHQMHVVVHIIIADFVCIHIRKEGVGRPLVLGAIGKSARWEMPLQDTLEGLRRAVALNVY